MQYSTNYTYIIIIYRKILCQMNKELKYLYTYVLFVLFSEQA